MSNKQVMQEALDVLNNTMGGASIAKGDVEWRQNVAYKLGKAIEEYDEQAQEPAAWCMEYDLTTDHDTVVCKRSKMLTFTTPLYTHSQRELSDDEVENMICKHTDSEFKLKTQDARLLVRAVLDKAKLSNGA